MNEIKIFQNAAFGEVRATVLNGEPMFCLADLCKILELSNPSAIKTRLDKEDVQLLDLHALNLSEGSTGNSMTNFVTESGFYDVILYSNSPIAKTFRKWVTSEVLPSIRKTGAYSLPQDYLSALKALVVAEEEKQRLASENRVMKPKAEYFDALVDRKLLTNFRDTAKELGFGQNAFIDWLFERKFIYRDKKRQIRPYSDYANTLFEIKEFKASHGTHAGVQTLITPKGRETFRLLLGRD